MLKLLSDPTLLLVVSVAGVSLVWPQDSSVAQETRASVENATIEDFAWLAGNWRGTGLGGVCEETWSPPLAGTMVGSFRLVKAGEILFYEILVLGADKDGMALKVKHFSKDFVSWEEKGKSVRFALESVKPNAARFAGLTMKRRRDMLEISVRMRSKTGDVSWEPFRLRRAGLRSSTPSLRTGQKQSEQSMKDGFLESLVGRWAGNCKTWTQPGKLTDESKVKGEFRPIRGGRCIRHTYIGEMQGKPRSGEETIAFNAIERKYQVSWFDEFHMNHALMFSEGKRTEKGFSVKGSYRLAPGQRPWGWRTEFELIDDDHLTITAYNVSPDGREARAVETVYRRIKADDK